MTPSPPLPQDLETLLQGVIFPTFLNVHLVPFPYVGLLLFISACLGPQFSYLWYGVDASLHALPDLPSPALAPLFPTG